MPLPVSLSCTQADSCKRRQHFNLTFRIDPFPIELVMALSGDFVDGEWIFVSDESEASTSQSVGILHHSRFLHFAERRKVLAEGIRGRLPGQSTCLEKSGRGWEGEEYEGRGGDRSRGRGGDRSRGKGGRRVEEEGLASFVDMLRRKGQKI